MRFALHLKKQIDVSHLQQALIDILAERFCAYDYLKTTASSRFAADGVGRELFRIDDEFVCLFRHQRRSAAAPGLLVHVLPTPRKYRLYVRSWRSNCSTLPAPVRYAASSARSQLFRPIWLFGTFSSSKISICARFPASRVIISLNHWVLPGLLLVMLQSYRKVRSRRVFYSPFCIISFDNPPNN